ncbi:hypothetical protein ACRCQN_31465, partial [Pseudomonas aeruginosa]
MAAGDDQRRRLDQPELLTEISVAYRSAVGRVALLSFSEDGCAKCQKPNALQQQRGLNPSGNDGRQAAT